MIQIQIIYTPDTEAANNIRTLFCKESQRQDNPLIETNFNELLQEVAQIAFDEGRNFQKNNPNIKA